jgi:hypothetical protein
MTAAERERLRLSLLQQLREVGADSSLPLSTIVLGARLAGFNTATEETVRGELVYLLDKGCVATPQKTISPENKRWRITAAGTDYLAESGL